jgi:hypothetical protein
MRYGCYVVNFGVLVHRCNIRYGSGANGEDGKLHASRMPRKCHKPPPPRRGMTLNKVPGVSTDNKCPEG